MKKHLFTAIFLLVAAFTAIAQTRTVKGIVKSAEDNTGMPGVGVLLEGTKTSTITDVNGAFQIEVPGPESRLVFSFVGMQTQTVTAGTGDVNVTLKTGVELQEVVVTSFGVSREKKSLGYAVQEIKGDKLKDSRETNLVNALSGRVAGVNITSSSGAVGASSSIILRGASSFTGNNAPLFVINGVPVDNSTNAANATEKGRTGAPDYGNAISDINSDDIESINVLKGPTAAALYGSRAQNGAIIITTKSGKGIKGKASDFQVSYNTGYSNDQVLLLPKFQNKYGQGYEGDEPDKSPDYLQADESWGAPLDGRDYTDYRGERKKWIAQPNNVKDFFVNGHTFDNSVAIAGSDEKSSFRLSLSSLNQTGTVPNTAYNRYNAGLTAAREFTKKFNAEFNVNYTLSNGQNRPGVGYDSYNPLQSLFSWFGRQVNMTELRERYNEVDPTTGLHYNWNPVYHNNPYWTLYNNPNKDRRDRIVGNVKLNYKLTDWLTASLRGGTDFYSENRKQVFAVGTIDYGYMQKGGFYNDDIRYVSTNWDGMLNFNKQLNSDFSISGILGYNSYSTKRDYDQVEVRGLLVPKIYNTSNAANNPINTNTISRKMINGAYASASVGYKGYIYLDVTGRNDWSSTLPANNRSYFYPSVSGSFVFSELIQNNKVLSYGKVRVGYSKVGNDTRPYALTTVFRKPIIGADPSTITFPFNGTPSYEYNIRINNSSLKPESTTSFEIGTELKFLSNRISLDVAYYNQNTKDQLVPLSIPSSSGFTSKFTNAGEIENQGVEIMFSAIPVKTENFTWDIGVNFSKNIGKIISIAEGLDKIFVDREWASIYLVQGHAYGTIYGTDYQKSVNGDNLIGPTGLPVRTADIVPLGDVQPKFRMGLENTVSYKGVTFGFLLDWKQGGLLYSITNKYGEWAGILAVTEDRPADGIVVPGSKANGTANTTAVSAMRYWHAKGNIDAPYVYDASYVKLRQVNLSYRLPVTVLEKTPFSRIELGVYARNFWLIYSKVPNIDPEVNTFGAGNAAGIESTNIPSTKTLGANLKLTF